MATSKKDEFEGMGRAEIRAALKKKGILTLAEAARFLGYKPKTLMNMNCEARRDPEAAPRGTKRGSSRSSRVEYRVADLEAWEKARAEQIGA